MENSVTSQHKQFSQALIVFAEHEIQLLIVRIAFACTFLSDSFMQRLFK